MSLSEVDLSVSIPAVVGVVLAATVGSRIIRLAGFTTGLREYLDRRSKLLRTLISCPHCLCFWISLGGALALAHAWFEGVAITVLGWQVAYHLNRRMDRQGSRTRSTDRPAWQPRGQRRCRQCGKPWRRGFLEHQGRYFCSLTCRIGYLRDTQLSRRQAATEIFAADGTPVKRDLYAAPAPEIGATEARALLESDQGYAYLDVRSAREFESGHPAGAVNVPLYHRRSDGLVPNHAFLQGIAAYFRQDTRLLVGGGNGNRAELATGGLLAAGYTSVTPVRGGYAGVRDLLGRTVAPGWRQLGLPVEQGPSPDPGYTAATR